MYQIKILHRKGVKSMQRTVKSTKVIFAKVEIDNNGQLMSTLGEHIVHTTDEKRAIKETKKMVGEVAVVKTETVEKLWVLDDEIFLKYAKPVETNEE